MTTSILLTGATGFVGRQILKHLSANDIQIRIVVRENAENKLSAFPSIQSITTPDLFCENSRWWIDACKEIDVVIHAAWYVEPGMYLQSPKNLNCLTGTLELAKGAAEAGVRRFIGLGTCFEYDLKGGLLAVETPINPITVYAAAKAATFMTLSQYLPQQSVEFAWCRLFYLYGEGEDDRRFVPYLRKQLSIGEPAQLTSGNQIRDFLDVCEAGSQIAQIALSNQQGPINICSGIPITIRQLAERIADEYDRRDLLYFGARPDNLIDPHCVVGIKNKE